MLGTGHLANLLEVMRVSAPKSVPGNAELREVACAQGIQVCLPGG